MSDPAPTLGPEKPAGPSNLRLRIISALVLIPLALLVTWWGGLVFRVFVAIVALAMIYEWLTITAGRDMNRTHWVTGGLLAALTVMLVAGISPGLLLVLTIAAAAVALVEAMSSGRGSWAPLGLLYAGLSAIALAMLRGEGAAGLWAILFLFAVVWVTDIAAYFVGRALRGPKLAPRISPGKTWSGAIGGTIAGIAAGLAVASIGDSRMGVAGIVLLAFVLSVVAQLGDLFESHLKRRFFVKDSGSLIPGHGGVMDRVDGLVAAAVAFYVVGMLLTGPSNPAQAFFTAG
ncbi:MAG: phosphatidate cytidylyltransferase [Mesorhizobium sp.]|nr:phosphatidate cytidylyltransferase [Mesorhizobium sp.]